MKIIQVTDLHLTPSPEGRTGGINTLKCCETLLAGLRNEKADILVITGDIAAETEDLFCYSFLRDQLRNMPFPFVILPGNHDRGNYLREIFGSCLKTGFSQDPKNEGILYFDNSTEEPAHLDELKQHLNTMAEPSCLFTHYPPIPVGHPSFDGKHSLPWRGAFLDVLQSTQAPLFVFFGHIHFNFAKEIGLIQFYSTPSATTPVIQGETEDLPDQSGLYFREIFSSQAGWETTLRKIS